MATEGKLTWRESDAKTEQTDFRFAAQHRRWRLPGPQHRELERRNPPGVLATPYLAGIGCAHSTGQRRSESPAVPTHSSRTGWGLFPTAEARDLTCGASRGRLSHSARGAPRSFLGAQWSLFLESQIVPAPGRTRCRLPRKGPRFRASPARRPVGRPCGSGL